MKKKVIVIAAVAIAIGTFLVWHKRNEKIQSPSHIPTPSAENGTAGAHGGTASISNAEPKEDFNEISARAHQGDAEAQKKLSAIYAYCIGYSNFGNTALWDINQVIKKNDLQSNGAKMVRDDIVSRCSKFEGGRKIGENEYEDMLLQSAKNGNFSAKIKLVVDDAISSGKPIDEKQIEELLIKIKENKNPDAIFEMGRVAYVVQNDSVGGGILSGRETAEYAWEVAACRMGANCNRGSVFMNGICMGTGACNYSNYEDVVKRHFLPEGARAAFDNRVNELMSFIQNIPKERK